MSPDGDAESRADFLKQIKNYSRLIYETATTYSLVGQLKTASFEKIVILNGATLTLIFGIVTSLSTKLTLTHGSAFGLHQLIVACWLFVISILTSILHNLFLVNSVINSQLIALVHNFTFGRDILRIKGAPFGLKLAESENSNFNVENKKKARLFGEAIARVFGIAAQVSTIFAFIYLMVFIQGNLNALLGG